MRKTAVKTGGSGGPYMLVAVCFNSVNVLQEDGSIKLLNLDTF